MRPIEATYDEIAAAIRKSNPERIVWTNGCFDVFHRGHLELLRYCRSVAGPKGIVVVGMNDDDGVMRIKGPSRPIVDCESRALIVAACRFVDHVMTFSEDTPIDAIRALRPDAIVKGSEYLEAHVVGRELAPVLLAPQIDGWSTTKLMEKIIGLGREGVPT